MATDKIYELVTDKILDELAKGTIPWRKPWKFQPGTGPSNYASNRPYHGINAILLGMMPYDEPRWLTYKKAVEYGGQVRKGEKGMPVVFWKWIESTDKDGNPKQIPFLRYYTVFNLEQIDGFSPSPLPALAGDFNPIDQAEQIIANMPKRPSIDHNGGDGAYYMRLYDEIHLPIRPSFESPDEYYSTVFHELTHSTGHQKRLGRHLEDTELCSRESRSTEELVAEFGAAFLSHQSGISNTLQNSASYIDGWSTVLKRDKKLILQAASKGQKAADYIMAGQ